MRISLQCCFDVGHTFGVTDAVFKPMGKHFEKDTRVTTTIAPGNSRGVRNQLGSGVRIKIPWDHPLTIKWQETAIEQEKQRADGPPRQRVLTLLNQLHPSQFFVNVFAVGIAFLRIDFLFDSNDKEHLLPFYDAYQYAGYQESISKELKTLVAKVTDSCQNSRQPFSEEIFDRNIPETEFIPSFILVVESDQLPRTHQQVNAHRFNEAPTPPEISQTEEEMQRENIDLLLRLRTLDIDAPVKIDFQYFGTVYLGYAFNFIELRESWPATEEDREFERIWHSLEVAQVYLATCEMLANLMINNANRVVDEGGFGKTKKAQEYEQLRLLALAISVVTRFESTTRTGEDLRLFKEFELLTGLSVKRKAIVSASEILYAASEAQTERKQANRAYTLAWVLGLVSFLTLCSVVADILGGINWTDWGAKGILGSGPMARDEIVVAFVLVFGTLMLVIYRIAISISERPKRRRGKERRPKDRRSAGTGSGSESST